MTDAAVSTTHGWTVKAHVWTASVRPVRSGKSDSTRRPRRRRTFRHRGAWCIHAREEEARVEALRPVEEPMPRCPREMLLDVGSAEPTCTSRKGANRRPWATPKTSPTRTGVTWPSGTICYLCDRN